MGRRQILKGPVSQSHSLTLQPPDWVPMACQGYSRHFVTIQFCPLSNLARGATESSPHR